MYKKIALCLFFLLIIPGMTANAARIAICQSMQHPALKDVSKGFRKYLNSRPGDFKFKIFKNLNHNALDKKEIKKATTELKKPRYDLIFCIGTPAAVICKNKIENKRIIFSAVTDPVQAGLVNSLEKSGGNLAGMTDMSPVGRQIQLIKQIQPQSRSLGVVYSKDEQNSRMIVDTLAQECSAKNFKLTRIGIENNDNITARLDAVLDNCDLLYVPTDNKVVAALDKVIKLCLEHKVPVYSGDPNSVNRGAVAALTIDYSQMGQESAKMALDVLHGANPANMPVRELENLHISLNMKTADLLDLEIPISLILAADVIYENPNTD